MVESLLVFVALIVGGIILFVWFRVIDRGAEKADEQREQLFARAARQLSWRLLPEGERKQTSELLIDFHLGSRPQGIIKNVIKGEVNGEPIYVIDYQTGSPPSSERFSHRHTAVLFVSKRLSLPSFMVLWRGGQSGGIALPDYPQFTADYAAIGERETAVQSLFSAEIIAFFADLAEDQKRVKHTRVEGNGRRLLYYRSDEHIDEINRIVREGRRAYELFAR